MILILGSPIESTIDKVIDWIYYFNPNKKVIRINSINEYEIYFKGDKIFLQLAHETVDLDHISSFWYRRGKLMYKFKEQIAIPEYQIEEANVLEEFLNYKLKQKRHISDLYSASVNKLIVLEEAKKVGLNIPKTYLMEDLDTLTTYQNQEELITKTYLESSTFKFSNANALMYTQEVKQLENVPNRFAPSLFQNRINKKVELRVFYLNGEMWAMAIFSQSDTQTALDFRIYNKAKPNRNSPFLIPSEIQKKIITLMQNLNLNTGSIDMILDHMDNYIFLEINPVGQFGMVSYPCNYNLEKKIAKYLCDEN